MKGWTHAYRLLLAGGLAAAALSAHAAGIDCAKAKTHTERLVCADAAVKQLDTELGGAYDSVLSTAADPAGLVHAQRDWLKQRDACADAACLSQAYRDRLAALKQVRPAGWKTYHDPALGISFEYLENRQIKPCPERGGRCVALVGRGMDRNSPYLIAFEVVDGPLEQVAADKAGFERQDDGKWHTTYGRGESMPVESFAGHGWKGMRATIACGIDDEAGFHAAVGECFWAVMSNGKRSVVADTAGTMGTDEASQHSVQTLRFDP
jgi:uncharacterized protein